MASRVEGVKETIRALDGFIKAEMKMADREVELGAGRAVSKTQKYPPPLAGSTYERTGIYGKTFSIRRIGQGQRLMTSNAIQRGRGYSPFVGGGERGQEQAAIHHGRWPVFLDEVTKEAKETGKRIDKKTKGIARSKGL
jgi:hypothetical protein